MDLEQYVFHYSGAGPLISIVTGRSLWATSIEFMNDRFEGELPKRTIQDMIKSPDAYLKGVPYVDEKFLEALRLSLGRSRHAVSVSFSRHWKSLPQFRLYSPSAGGYAIGFPLDYLSKIANLIECNYSNKDLWAWCRSYVTEYLNKAASFDSKHKNAAELNNEIINSTDLIQRRVIAGLTFKSDEFINEAEVRLCTFTRCTRFRESRDGNLVIPYHVVELPNEAIEVPIVYGPNRDPVLSSRSVGNLADAARNAGTTWNMLHLSPGEFGFRA